MPRARPLPPHLVNRAFTVGEARDEAVARSRLRALDLSAPFHGVRAHGDEIADTRAYATRMTEPERFTHTTAAQLHGMRMPPAFRETVLHVGIPRPLRAPRSAGVVGHQVPTASPVVSIDGLRASPPLTAWVQCAAVLTVDELIIMGDGLLARHRPHTTLEQLREYVAAHAGNRGCGRLRSALSDIRPRTDSAMETVLRLTLARAGFPEPEINGPIRNEYGLVIAHGDLVYRDEGVVIEYDGAGHWEPQQAVRDVARLDAIMEQGLRVIRVDKTLLHRRATLLGKVERALGTRAP